MDASQTAHEHHSFGQAEDRFFPILRLLRSLSPSLEELAPRFREAGIKDAQRLRAVAGWEVQRRRRWLSETLVLDAFEEEVLGPVLDEINSGIQRLL